MLNGAKAREAVRSVVRWAPTNHLLPLTRVKKTHKNPPEQVRRHDSAHLHRNIKHIEPDGPPGCSPPPSGGQRSQQEEAESAFGLFPLLNEFRQHLITNHTLLLEKQTNQSINSSINQSFQSLMQDWLQNQVEGGETKTSSEGTKVLTEPVRTFYSNGPIT